MTDEPEPGSVPLKNARWELFAQGYASKGNARQAYIAAGYKETGAAQAAHRLLTNVDVKARVDNLRLSKWKALRMSDDELLAEASKIARFNISRITHITPSGEPYIDLSMADEDDLAAITELQIEDFTDGREVDEEGNVIKRDVRRVKAKAPNKLQAIALLAKISGLLKDKVEVTLTEDFADTMQRARDRARAARKQRETGNAEQG